MLHNASQIKNYAQPFVYNVWQAFPSEKALFSISHRRIEYAIVLAVTVSY